MVDFPKDQKFKVILADPPWNYSDKASAGKRGASFKYKTQSDQWIMDLPVESIADDNCALFLWITMPKLPVAFEVIKNWNFTYKTCAFNWIKTNKKSGTPFFGMGNFTRSNSELCLLATRGKPKRISASVHSVVMSPIRKHSQKPDEVRDRIVELMGDVSRIELFARNRSGIDDGWVYWGDEVEKEL